MNHSLIIETVAFLKSINIRYNRFVAWMNGMDDGQKDFLKILSCEAFKRFMSSGLKLSQVQALMVLLIKFRIPFDISYDPGNRKNESEIELEVYINPHSTLVFSIGAEIDSNL